MELIFLTEKSEVFAQGEKDGSDMQVLLSDACVLLSLALQHGLTVKDLLKSTGDSVIGAVLSAIEQEQQDLDDIS